MGSSASFQHVAGTAEEKIPLILQDIDAWPFRGIVVVHGEGFSPDFKAFICGSGKVVDFEDLPIWLENYFDLPENCADQAELALNGEI